jgi:hypothetical protein
MTISALAWLGTLHWIDGRPLMVEPYRRDIFRRALDDRRQDGAPAISMVLAGRAKKNFKSADLILAGLYCLMIRESPQGSDVLLVANDAGQACDDLDLAKRIVGINPDLADALEVFSDEIRRRDGRGTMQVLASNNAIGQHGKTAVFIGYDEIHGFANWDLMEALQPDPTRYCLQWITSYDSILDVDGAPLHDLKKIGKAGTDPGMLFSWYSADYCTDPAFVHLPPDERANPSMASWPEGRAYLDQQRRRLPSARFRRLHHNLPGAPQGAFFDQGKVEAATAVGRQVCDPVDGVDYLAAVDMSGGSSDDAAFSISHWDATRNVAVQDVLIDQGEPVPFNPRIALSRFALLAKSYRCKTVHGDAYAGETFRRDFDDCGLGYVVTKKSATELYEDMEVAFNTGQAELLDQPKLRRQLLTLVRKGAAITHPAGQHDDHANVTAIALVLVNPDLGAASIPWSGLLEHYRRQSEAITATAETVPSLQQQHGGEAIMQGWMRRPSDGFVRVVVPCEASHLHVRGVAYLCEIEGGQRVAWMTPADAFDLLGSTGTAPFIDVNRPLLDKLRERAKAEGYRPGDDLPGIRARDILNAAADQREARVMTRAEEVQAFLQYRSAYARETLELIGRSPR